jgi:hypothetical protein
MESHFKCDVHVSMLLLKPAQCKGMLTHNQRTQTFRRAPPMPASMSPEGGCVSWVETWESLKPAAKDTSTGSALAESDRANSDLKSSAAQTF